MFVTKLRNSTQPYFSHQNFMMLFTNNLFRLVGWRLVLIMLLWWWVIKLLWLMSILLSRRLELLRHWLCWRVTLLWIIRLLMLLLFKPRSLLLIVRIHWDILAGLILMLLHVLESVIVNLNVDFPIRMLLVDFFNDLIAEIFISSDHDKSITKSIECSSGVSFDDSKRYKMIYLTSLTSVYLLSASLMKGSVIERGIWPIYNLL